MERFQELRKLSPGQVAFRIKEYRQKYEMTQEVLAKRLGVGKYSLIRWETARVKISNIMLKLLMDEGIV